MGRSSSRSCPCVIVFAKAPVPGEVKTRLQPRIPPDAATLLYRAMVEDVVSTLRGSEGDSTLFDSGSHDLAVFFTPRGGEDEFLRWFPDLELVSQEGRNLGERMLHAFTWARERGHDRVVIVGTDLPTLTSEAVDEALDALSSVEVVLGPCSDGGYYLVGAREPHRELFEGVAWSTPGVLETTMMNAKDSGLSVRLLPEERDVDTYEDVLFLRSRLAEEPRGRLAPRTARVLGRLPSLERELT